MSAQDQSPDPQTALEQEGWGTPDPAGPTPEVTTTAPAPWFRRPAPLITGAGAVIIIVALVIALVVVSRGGDADDTAAAAAPSTTVATVPVGDQLTSTDLSFLRGISPLMRRSATDRELLEQADYICTSLNGTQTDQQLAVMMTAMDVADWTGMEPPQVKGEGYTLDMELANLTVNFMKKAEAAYCPNSWPSGGTGSLVG